LLTVVVLCLSLHARGQSIVADSLRRLIVDALKKSAQPDSVTLNRISQLAENFFESYPDSSFKYANLEIELSQKAGYLKEMAKGYSQVAAVEVFWGDYNTAKDNYTAALKIYSQIHNIHGIATCYTGIGRINDYLGNYNEAIRLFERSLAYAQHYKNRGEEAERYVLLGMTYDNKGNFSKALDCYFRALDIDIQQKDDLGAADSYCDIGVVMQHVELYPKALEYFEKALKIWNKYHDRQGISTAWQNIGEVMMSEKKYELAGRYLVKAAAEFYKLGDADGISLIECDLGLYHYYINQPDSALFYLNRSIAAANGSKIKYNRAFAYQGLALVYNLLHNYPQAKFYAEKAQATASNLGSLNIKADATRQLSRAFGGLGNYREAYEQDELYNTLHDSLKSNESIHKLIFYNVELDFARKQVDATKQQELYRQKMGAQKRTNVIYAIVMVAMAFLAVIYYFAQLKQRRINNLLEEKNQEIIAQRQSLNDLNLLKDRLIGVLAHDLRAPISTLRGLFTLMTDDGISHKEFIEMVPKVFNTLENSSDFLDTLLFWINSQVDASNRAFKSFAIQELVNRELMHMEDQLKEKDLSVHVDIEPDAIAFADPNSTRIVIHNLFTNAIKFSNRGGVIDVFSKIRENGKVYFCLTDHGIGMSADYVNNLFKTQVQSVLGTESEKGTGMGLFFCKDLIEKNNGTIWAESTPGEGTRMCFELPVQNKSVQV
jgi:signal transduction histidine kinase